MKLAGGAEPVAGSAVAAPPAELAPALEAVAAEVCGLAATARGCLGSSYPVT